MNIMTDEQLGEIGAKAAYEETSVCASWQMAIAPQNSYYSEDAVKRTAFARAVREAIFADCGEVPNLDKCIELYHKPGNHASSMLRVQQACTAPLLKRISELEKRPVANMQKCPVCEKTFSASYNHPAKSEAEWECPHCLVKTLSRIRALPEKWNSTQFKILHHCNANEACANELLAALGETEQQVDPYAELKAAHKAGKVIQWLVDGEWIDLHGEIRWNYKFENYRIKPWSLPPPPEGRQWHRDDWTEEMLPEGWRPLFYNEIPISGDERLDHTGNWTDDLILSRDVPRKKSHFHTRTKRPLPTPPTFVPLEAKDVPPLSLVRRKELSKRTDHWTLVVAVHETGVKSSAENFASFECLMEHYEISTDHGATWKPCRKMKEGN